MNRFILFVLLFSVLETSAQKKPLDHTVYDSWQSIGERQISNNGEFVAYTIAVQEGDANLVLQRADGKKLLEIARGYLIKFSNDNNYLICKIKPLYAQTRDARIKKKKPDEMPKDSLAIVELSTLQVEMIARVKNYKVPEMHSGWLAYSMEKPLAEVLQQKKELDSLSRIKSIAKVIDSLTKEADSLRNKLAQVQRLGLQALKPRPETSISKTEESSDEGTVLYVRNLSSGAKKTYTAVNDFLFNKYGNTLLYKSAKKGNSIACIVKVNLNNLASDTLLRNFNDAKGLATDEEGKQAAFVVERDSVKKESQKFYKLYYSNGTDTAKEIASRFSSGIPNEYGISEYSNLIFSKNGERLFFGTARILPPKDSSLPEFERVNVDVWNYKDEDLMSWQLHFNDTLLKRNHLAVYDINKNRITQLGSDKYRIVDITEEGNGNTFYAASDSGRRVEKQWQGYTLEDWASIDPNTGRSRTIITSWKGRGYPSYKGKYLLLYNEVKRAYYCYNSVTGKLNPVAADIKVPLYDEENDEPADPAAHGILKWTEGDKYVLIYDKYDVWKVDPDGIESSIAITHGRPGRVEYRYEQTGPEEKFITNKQPLFFRTLNLINKENGLAILSNLDGKVLYKKSEPMHLVSLVKAKDANTLLIVKESFVQSPNVFMLKYNDNRVNDASAITIKLSETNPQQTNYNWGTSSLFKWKAYTGKLAEGILYKPEDFDAHKKYPMIVYFYDRSSSTLYNYQPPAPTPSRLNISFFVSRGYIVFVPDIWYHTGHPGKSAYDYIVSGTRSVIKEEFIDSNRIGIQGQSWGGYQTAYVITQTNLYKAAWAGAPVVNMFSAYGGIRWESGITRQVQYEHGQSRIGANLWEKPDLYIENSPLFHLKNIKTPLVIMSNDADGAVPWYQGIEFFTAMRRLNKPAWLLVYNGEAHNLVERKNRKDIQIREQQFFDWLLKGAPAARWLKEGVPATMKGRNLGLETDK